MLPDRSKGPTRNYIPQKRNHFKQNRERGIEARPKAC